MSDPLSASLFGGRRPQRRLGLKKSWGGAFFDSLLQNHDSKIRIKGLGVRDFHYGF